jgi:hypothetical protein
MVLLATGVMRYGETQSSGDTATGLRSGVGSAATLIVSNEDSTTAVIARSRRGLLNAGIEATSTGPDSNGVKGEASNGLFAAGVWGISSAGYAGWFSGKVRVTGELQVSGPIQKGGGGFRIDHPLRPKDKYLCHSYVEADVPLNIYSGRLTTDDSGAATVKLPDYFEALNHDYRYQLTVIGDFSLAVVAEEIADNQFVIKTDRPNVTVSWQVAGVRRDGFARLHPLTVEEDKPPEERGTYLHPEAFGEPDSRGTNYLKEKALEASQAELDAESRKLGEETQE